MKTYFNLQKMWSTLFCITALAFFTVSCMEKDVYKGDGDDDESVPNLFDFSTKSEVKITLDYATDYAVSFEMYYSNPLSLDGAKSYVKNIELTPFIYGKTDGKGKLSITFPDMPNTEKDIYVYSPNLTVPTLLHATVNGGEVVLTTASKVTNLSRIATRAASASGDFYNKWEPKNCTYVTPLGDWDTQGNANYLNQGENIDKYKLNITEKFKRTISGTLELDEPSYGKYLTHELMGISKRAYVYVNFVSHHNSERNNALAYYTLAPNEEVPATAPTRLAVAFPNLRAEGLNGGDVIQLKYYDSDKNEWVDEFPADSRIGFVLLVDAFEDGKLSERTNLMYSDRKYNSYYIEQYNSDKGSYKGSRPQMLAFTADGNLVLSFEDQPWNDNRKKGQPAFGSFNDDTFTITANPITALPDVNPGTDPQEPEEEKGDFSTNSSGILAFEDNWPSQGDYDMNDVVFAYQRTLNMLMSDNFRVVSIDETYIFKNNGASYANGFGYVIGGGVKRDDVEVTVTSDMQSDGMGLDPDLEDATVMLTNNAKAIPVGTTFTVKTKFKPGKRYEFSDFGFNPYNPFIVVMKKSGENYLATNRTEVHLPKNFKPTPKADPSLFGTESDLSGKGNNFYYISSGNYPFALEIATASEDIPNFAIPTETKRIEVSYPKFIDWVKDPKNNADWWKQ